MKNVSPAPMRCDYIDSGVYVPADDFTDPAVVHTFSHLSASIVLSRKRASEGLYPAVDPLQSRSKMSLPSIIGERHYRVAQEVRRSLRNTKNSRTSSRCLASSNFPPRTGRPVFRARRLERFLTQPFITTEHFTGAKGKMVSLDETIEGCERILHDEFKDWPETALVHDRLN